jgi:hypothetical protein
LHTLGAIAGVRVSFSSSGLSIARLYLNPFPPNVRRPFPIHCRFCHTNSLRLNS